MTVHAQILSPWAGSGADGDEYRPQLLDDYPIASYRDVTNRPGDNIIPAVNLMVADVVVPDAVYALIEADPAYAVLWSEAE